MTETLNKLIMVVLDGLRYDAARKYLGYMEHLVEQGVISCHQVQSELPSLSRPLYEVLLTGTPACKNGITANHIVRLSHEQSVFHLASAAHLRTAAAAYHWVSELYNSAPFNPITDRHQHNEHLPIQHGTFYFEDHYPDSHLFADAEYLRTDFDPHFLYIHSMNIDDAGHRYGG
jgi:predicted AlkP superfamily pyrophosphatase or phosphodiesterase